ncbi:MAG: GSCFA domain-containing protein [Flavobacterium sp.]
MNFTTRVPIEKSLNPISYDSKIVSLGSCFAENMAEKFDYFKFQNTCNPFGIIFNPVSIENIVARAVSQQYFAEADVFFHNERWHCFEVHSDLSHFDKEIFLNNLNQLLESTNNQITESTHIIITYGTSWVYRNKASKEIVANCHKVPQNQFDKEILSVKTIENSIQNTIDYIRKLNTDCTLIFTVSPVRHIKDGFVENQRSKAHLITAIHETINHQLQTINYFPSYEILMDELRDYRFYGVDMLHPNQIAIDYIWECFVKSNIVEESYPVMEEVDSIQKGMAHRPFNPQSESHLKFVKTLSENVDKLKEAYPFMKF